MARAEVLTKLSLDEWARIFGVNPLHFNGVEQPSPDPARTLYCKQPWFQYPYQMADRVGRDDVARAIQEAEAQMEEMLGFHLMPAWDYNEWRPTARPYRPELTFLNMSDVSGAQSAFALNWGYFISGGIEAAGIIDIVSVVYSDEDGDGYKELATIGPFVQSSTSLAENIEVHLPLTGHSAEYDEFNRIRPIQTHLIDNQDGTFTVTIRCRREQLVLTDKFVDLPPLTAVLGDDDSAFATNVEIWLHYNDPSTQATMLWESPSGCSCSNGCPSCQYAAQTACLIARGDPKLSMVAATPGTWNGSSFDTLCCLPENRAPDVIRSFYRSGWSYSGKATIAARWSQPQPSQLMDPHWARIVANFAASKLDRPVCDCSYTSQMVEQQQEDLAFSHGASELNVYSISPSDLNNPFGTKRGAVMAWKAIQSPALGRVALVR